MVIGSSDDLHGTKNLKRNTLKKAESLQRRKRKEEAVFDIKYEHGYSNIHENRKIPLIKFLKKDTLLTFSEKFIAFLLK